MRLYSMLNLNKSGWGLILSLGGGCKPPQPLVIWYVCKSKLPFMRNIYILYYIILYIYIAIIIVGTVILIYMYIIYYIHIQLYVHNNILIYYIITVLLLRVYDKREHYFVGMCACVYYIRVCACLSVSLCVYTHIYIESNALGGGPTLYIWWVRVYVYIYRHKCIVSALLQQSHPACCSSLEGVWSLYTTRGPRPYIYYNIYAYTHFVCTTWFLYKQV